MVIRIVITICDRSAVVIRDRRIIAIRSRIVVVIRRVRGHVPVHVLDPMPVLRLCMNVFGRQLHPAKQAEGGQTGRKLTDEALHHCAIIWNNPYVCKRALSRSRRRHGRSVNATTCVALLPRISAVQASALTSDCVQAGRSPRGLQQQAPVPGRFPNSDAVTSLRTFFMAVLRVSAIANAINTCYILTVQAVPSGTRADETTAAALPPRRWVLLALQLPATPSNARVKTWRRLQQLGAVPVKHAVYVLPASTQAVEDFAWLGREVKALGGQATVFQADAVDATSDSDIIDTFRRTRAVDYKQLLGELRTLKGRRPARRGSSLMKAIRAFRERLAAIHAIDFFAAPGRDEVETLLAEVEREAHKGRTVSTDHAPAVLLDRKAFNGRVWVTRPRPGVDRFACAWFIRRFIDADAQFDFITDGEPAGNAIAFDMYDVGFRHEGDRCTFEVLLLRFGAQDAAVRKIGEIVHDIDLKDDRYRSPQGPTISLLIDGLRASFADDHELLQQGVRLFEALYQAFASNQPKEAASPVRPQRRRTRKQ